MMKRTEIRVIRVDGMGFIATPNGEDILNAMATDYEKPDLKAYIKKANVGELETVSVGDGKTVVSRGLRPEEVLQFDVYTAKMAQIKTYAVGRLENDLFDKSF